MQEQEVQVRDKTAHRMGRGGRVETPLADTGDYAKAKREIQSGRKRQLYEVSAGEDMAGISTGSMEESKLQMAQGPEAADRNDALEAEADRELSEHSSRMEGIRGHPSNGRQYAEAAAETRRRQKKKSVQSHFGKESEKQTGGESSDQGSDQRNLRFRRRGNVNESTDSAQKEIKKKRKREQIKEQKKQASRLSFSDDENGMVQGAGMGMAKKAVSTATHSASVYAHGRGHEAEQENTAVEGAHRAELMAEHSLSSAMRLSRRVIQRKLSRWREAAAETGPKSRLKFKSLREKEGAAANQTAEARQTEKKARKHFWQKQQIKKSYQAAKRGEAATAESAKITRSAFDKVKNTASSVIKNNKGIFGAAAVLGLLFLMLSSGLSSCSAMIEGASSSIIGTTYLSTDTDIYDTENAYAALEEALNRQINNMESTHPGHDEYRYQIDEISHNPYHLVSYFTAKYGEFTYSQVKDEVEEIFREQYSLYVDEVNDTVTETKTVRVGESLGQVVTSGYCNCSICCGRWAGGATASGAYPTANHTIAVDASNPFVPMGTKVIMNGVEYVVEDTGAFARYGVQFDVYYDNHAAASAHGHKTWEAYIADSNGSQEIEVTTTKVVKRLEVTLTNHNLDTVLRSRLDANEEKRYDLYNATYGNRNYLFDVESLPGGADGFGYEIPPEALSDEKFARMIHEAEKYLGFPYTWGGSSPSTSFDCSGFVSWVVNNCGNGWNVGRQTAEGLRGCCAYVPPAEAKPGDLIFFQGTYATSGASHVGIYVGNNTMIHCGKPIQYAKINSPYWKQHFMAFGRLP